ncbi:MAG: aminoacetone oxidase family FAD-binding enzyme [Parcubacteria group bacterium]|nr:aminoacetone oxidase family FAD-binding enzyme [Parcubacteria group bacterium]
MATQVRKSAETYDIIVIGGGAAGMMAASIASARGKRVLLLEKNGKLGEKLAISGGGRCNILNAEEDARVLVSNYGAAQPFLHSPFATFGMPEAYAYFESNGLPLTVQAKNRAFPQSEHAKDVVEFFRRQLAEGKVTVQLRAPVQEIRTKSKKIEAVIAGGIEYSADAYILATGGVSRPETGSTGDGFGWLSDLGHTVIAPTPTIVPLKAKEGWVKDIAGKSAEAKVTFFANGTRKFSTAGPILFTHTGLSGPTILNAAGKVADLLHEGVVIAELDFFPKTDLGILDRELREHFDTGKNKSLKNAFKGFAPNGLSDALLSRLPEIDPETKTHSVTKEQRRLLAELLKGTSLTITGLLGFEKAVVADGGVPLTELDMKTMRSHKIENLQVVGDLLHISRPSGGYSLQLCWTTGFIAGSSA